MSDEKILSDEDVRTFLVENPQFLLEDAHLLSEIIKSAETKERKVFNLQGALIKNLENKVMRLNRDYKEIINTTLENMESSLKIQKAVIAMLDAQSPNGLVEILTEQCPSLFDVDFTALVLGYPSSHSTDENYSAFKKNNNDMQPKIVTISNDKIKNIIDEKKGSDKDVVVLKSKTSGSEIIYGVSIARHVRSEALIPLQIKDSMGILAFASKDPNRFHENQAKELLTFLGQVVERMLTMLIEAD